MSYLSMRMREIRKEEERRADVEAAFPMHIQEFGSDVGRVYGPMRVIDPGMSRILTDAIEQYEATLAAHNPHMRESVNWKGRAG